jgi:hypothetical protein
MRAKERWNENEGGSEKSAGRMGETTSMCQFDPIFGLGPGTSFKRHTFKEQPKLASQVFLEFTLWGVLLHGSPWLLAETLKGLFSFVQSSAVRILKMRPQSPSPQYQAGLVRKAGRTRLGIRIRNSCLLRHSIMSTSV